MRKICHTYCKYKLFGLEALLITGLTANHRSDRYRGADRTHTVSTPTKEGSDRLINIK